MNTQQSLELFGQALVDFFDGDTEVTLYYCRDDGFVDEFPVGVFFRGATDMPIDEISLSVCRGLVLDVGAGTGLHSLRLQELGFSVCAIDILPQACEIMEKRGVRDVRCTDISSFKEKPFDTVLILGRTIGNVGDLSGLRDFLKQIETLVTPEGNILLNSLDPRCTDDPLHLAYHRNNLESGQYIGEVRMHFEYKGHKGLPFRWLHVDHETLEVVAGQTGWICEILLQQDDGNYLARLEKERS